MSVIKIRRHNENIYNIESKPPAVLKKSPRYVSKFRKMLKEHNLAYTGNKCVQQHATMGLAEECYPNPHDYLKKGAGKPPYTRCRLYDQSKHVCQRKQKLVPSPDEVQNYDEHNKEVNLQKEKRNFIKENIKKAIKQKPKEPEQKQVLTRVGDSVPLAYGLEPVYCKNTNTFGKVPQYLQKFMQTAGRKRQLKKDFSGVEQPKCKYITKEEREILLSGLKQNWEELQKEYQVLPILTDTIPKVQRKLKYEADLKQLEKDIVLVETHPYIYVYNDDS